MPRLFAIVDIERMNRLNTPTAVTITNCGVFGILSVTIDEGDAEQRKNIMRWKRALPAGIVGTWETWNDEVVRQCETDIREMGLRQRYLIARKDMPESYLDPFAVLIERRFDVTIVRAPEEHLQWLVDRLQSGLQLLGGYAPFSRLIDARIAVDELTVTQAESGEDRTQPPTDCR
jgi:hypothetical protein